MKVRKAPLFFACWGILSVLCCVLLWRHAARYDYQHPFLISQNETYTVVVDDNDRQTTVLQLDRENRVVSRISQARVDQYAYHLASNLFYSGGAWYLVEFYNLLGGTDTRYALYYLDFEKQDMVELYDDFGARIQAAAQAQGMDSIQLNSRFSVQDGAFYVWASGITADGQQCRSMCFRLQNDTCTVEESRQVQGEVRGQTRLGNQDILLYWYDPGIYRGNRCLSDDYYSMLTVGQDGEIYALDQTNGKLRRINPESGALEAVSDFPISRLEDYGLTTLAVRDLSITDQENFAAAYFDLETAYILLGRDGQMEICSSSQLTPLPLMVVWSLLLILALGLAVMALMLTVEYLRRHGSVTVKLLCALLPIMALLTACSTGVVSAFLSQYNQQKSREVMLNVAQEVNALGIHKNTGQFERLLPIRTGDVTDLQAFQAYNDTYNALLWVNDNLMFLPDIRDAAGQSLVPNQIRCSVEYYVRDRAADSYYAMGGVNEFLPFDRWMSPEQTALFRDQIAREDYQLFDYYTDQNQKISGIIYPTRLDNGQVNGFYLITVDMVEGDNQITQIIHRFMLYQILLCALLLALFVTIIFLSLKPLSVLRRKARQFTDGIVPTFPPARPGLYNEITDLNETFQKLVGQVNENLRGMNRLQELSKAYFSPQILQLLGKSSVSYLSFHEEATCPLYIAYLALGEKTFEEIQELVTRYIPLLESCQGFFASVTGEEIVLVSQNQGLFYAAAAAAQESRELRVAFDYTPVTVRISGFRQEYRFLIAPENQNRKNALCAYRDAMGLRLLAFEGAFPADQTDLNSRMVGYLDGQALVEFFLDAFANKYRLGQRDLEQGVRLFFRGEREQARNSFVQALRFQPRDRVALYYIALIDAQSGPDRKEEGL